MNRSNYLGDVHERLPRLIPSRIAPLLLAHWQPDGKVVDPLQVAD